MHNWDILYVREHRFLHVLDDQFEIYFYQLPN